MRPSIQAHHLLHFLLLLRVSHTTNLTCLCRPLYFFEVGELDFWGQEARPVSSRQAACYTPRLRRNLGFDPFRFCGFAQKRVILRKGAKRPPPGFLLFRGRQAAVLRFCGFAQKHLFTLCVFAKARNPAQGREAPAPRISFLPRPSGRGSSLLRLCAKASLHAFASSQKRVTAQGREAPAPRISSLPRPSGRGSSLLRLCAKASLHAFASSQKRVILRKGAKRPPRSISCTPWNCRSSDSDSTNRSGP